MVSRRAAERENQIQEFIRSETMENRQRRYRIISLISVNCLYAYRMCSECVSSRSPETHGIVV